jgi:phosphoglycerate dehydrogenase-like enzyme
MLGMTGARNASLDTEACTARGVVVCNTVAGPGTTNDSATAELALGLMIAAARCLPAGDANIRAGKFQMGVPVGIGLNGKTLGLIGLGRLGSDMARYGNALGMKVIGWSQNLTAEKAAAAGATMVGKLELLSTADVVSIHLVLSPRSRGLIAAADLALMKPGAILVNTSRGPIVDAAALLAAVRAGRIIAALDVYDREPMAPDDSLRTAPNTVMTPHLGYCVQETWEQFYPQSIENALAFLDGKPVRVTNPEALQKRG